MPRVKYYNGKEVVEIEVSEKQLKAIKDIARTEDRQRKQIKRHSYHKPFDFDSVVSDELTLEENLIDNEILQERNELKALLAISVSKLKPEQQEIVRLAFYENKNLPIPTFSPTLLPT